MRQFERREEIQEALKLLGRNMALNYAPDIRLLCCGGSGLCVLEILSRTTKDVDALAIITDDEILAPITEFSPEMDVAISKTARSLGLADDWLNAEASSLLDRGLPEGILQRSAIHSHQYGPCLTVQFIDRVDQVALKLLAAMDPTNGRRHVEDLVKMRPAEDEIRQGLDWLLAWRSNVEFKKRLAFLVDALGFPELAETVTAAMT